MMASLFEDFAHGPFPGTPGEGSVDSTLESFDKGYKAGWDDASKAHGDSQSHASGVLARNVETMEFTLVEARAMVLDALRPVLSEIAQTLLPSISAQALQSLLQAELVKLIDGALPDHLQIEASSQDQPALTALLDAENLAGKVNINVRDTLGEGQVYVSFGDATTRINIPKAIEDIAAALAAFDPIAHHEELEHAHAG